MNFKHSLRHMPIYYLSDLGSEVALSYKFRELLMLKSGTLFVEDFRAKLRLHVKRAVCQ